MQMIFVDKPCEDTMYLGKLLQTKMNKIVGL